MACPPKLQIICNLINGDHVEQIQMKALLEECMGLTPGFFDKDQYWAVVEFVVRSPTFHQRIVDTLEEKWNSGRIVKDEPQPVAEPVAEPCQWGASTPTVQAAIVLQKVARGYTTRQRFDLKKMKETHDKLIKNCKSAVQRILNEAAEAMRRANKEHETRVDQEKAGLVFLKGSYKKLTRFREGQFPSVLKSVLMDKHGELADQERRVGNQREKGFTSANKRVAAQNDMAFKGFLLDCLNMMRRLEGVPIALMDGSAEEAAQPQDVGANPKFGKRGVVMVLEPKFAKDVLLVAIATQLEIERRPTASGSRAISGTMMHDCIHAIYNTERNDGIVKLIEESEGSFEHMRSAKLKEIDAFYQWEGEDEGQYLQRVARAKERANKPIDLLTWWLSKKVYSGDRPEITTKLKDAHKRRRLNVTSV